MYQPKYQELFNKEAKQIGYFADKLFLERDNAKFLRILTQCFVPEIENAKYCESFRSAITGAIDQHNQEYRDTVSDLSQIIESHFNNLKIALENEKFFGDKALQNGCKKIEELFKLKGLPGTGSYLIRELLDCFLMLCNQVIDLERVDLIKNFAEMKYFPERVESNGTCSLRPTIYRMAFGNLIERFYELEEKFSWDATDPFVAFYYLQLATSCYNSPIKIEKKGFNNFGEKLNGLFLLGISTEITLLKKNKSSAVNFFMRTRILDYVSVIIDSLLITLGKNKLNEYIYSLELEMSSFNNELILIVKKSDQTDGTKYKIHKFNDGSAYYKYMTQSIEKPGCEVDISNIRGTTNIADCWGRIGIKPIAKIFFKQKDTHVTVFNGNPIILANMNNVDYSALWGFIETLKKI